jgi:hypothetical protein
VTRRIGPYSLYWACRIQGANAYRAGKVITDCPYDHNRIFRSRLARRLAGRCAAAGVRLPHKGTAE